MKLGPKSAKMRILVVGGTRFIGAFTVKHLVQMGHEVAVFHRGQTSSGVLPDVEKKHILGDRKELENYKDKLKRFSPDVVLDAVAFTEADAQTFVGVFKGVASRSVVLSSGDVYQAFGVLKRSEEAPVQSIPLNEDAPLRQKHYLFRSDELRAGFGLAPFAKPAAPVWARRERYVQAS